MAVTVAQAATQTPDDLVGGVLETIVQSSKILDKLPLKGISGPSMSYNREAALPGVEFRAVNAAYSESTGTVAQATEKLSILGGDVDVDLFIQATGSSLNDQRAIQTRMKMKAASLKFDDAFFNGDSAVDVNSFDGLKKRLTGSQVITMGTNGAPALGNGTTDADLFLDKLDELIGLAGLYDTNNGMLGTSDYIATKLTQVGRRKGLVTDGELVFGTQSKKVAMYRGVPIVATGVNAAGTAILPQTETQGTSTDCSSVYAIRFGQDESDQAVTGLYNTNTNGDSIFAVRDLGEQDAKPVIRTRVEGYVGIALFGGKAAARLTGVRNA